MNENNIEGNRARQSESLKERLEEVRRMILDTQAEMAQVREDAVEKPDRARELVPLKRALDTLEAEKSELENHPNGSN